MTYPLTIGRMSFQVANIHIFLNTNAKKNKVPSKDTENQQDKNNNCRPQRPAEGCQLKDGFVELLSRRTQLQ